MKSCISNVMTLLDSRSYWIDSIVSSFFWSVLGNFGKMSQRRTIKNNFLLSPSQTFSFKEQFSLGANYWIKNARAQTNKLCWGVMRNLRRNDAISCVLKCTRLRYLGYSLAFAELILIKCSILGRELWLSLLTHWEIWKIFR